MLQSNENKHASKMENQKSAMMTAYKVRLFLVAFSFGSGIGFSGICFYLQEGGFFFLLCIIRFRCCAACFPPSITNIRRFRVTLGISLACGGQQNDSENS
eukprot:Gregarina_sp_Poly_1__2801@NODE_177_length_11964_cov_73_622174_g157_i0_p18_GENE_NODE_177_length_11964_cov_73_622174_g157_i0NODE_177_length_11964_cov_73_622174_g157_i0_p18_ORF_typecomplete_len100_score8_707TM_GPCR_Srx/PF10328_9/747TM_GPCR_Srx/PF10328_9/0_44_NODE_177_length_11964_cov_73_622174_g157_i027293028